MILRFVILPYSSYPILRTLVIVIDKASTNAQSFSLVCRLVRLS